VNVSETVLNLTPYLPTSTAYHYRLVATNNLGTSLGPDQTFFTLPPEVPAIGSLSAAVNGSSATVSAMINPGGGPTTYVAEYGTDTSYGTTTVESASIGEDHSNHQVSQEFEGLQPGTTYHYRFVATNFGGTGYSQDQTFTTPGPPRIETGGSSRVGQSSAHLEALVVADGSPTDVSFEYGTTTAYGSQTSPVAIGSEFSARGGAADVGGLAAGTTYHFRVVASNALGTTRGPDLTFATQAAPTKENEKKPLTCPKGKVKRHGKCVKPHKHRHKRRSGKRHG
jgi:hypothetical protein